MSKLTKTPSDHAAKLPVWGDDPRSLGDKPDHVPARTPES